MSSKFRIIAPAILAFSVPCAVLLGISEIYLRYQHQSEQARIALKYKGRALTFTRSKDPGLVYEFIPNRNGTNSHGYMDDERSYEKPKGMFRIVIIGDSVAQGQGVKPEEKFGSVIERSLNRYGGKNSYEVITLARSGYSTSQELIILEKEAFRYAPELILWSYMLNDPAHPIYHAANGELGRYFYEPSVYVLDFISRKLFLAVERWKARNCPKEYHQYLHCVYWERVQASLGKLGEISKRQGTPMVFLIHPIFQKSKTFAGYRLSGLHEKLREQAFGAGLIPLDLLAAYQNYEPGALNQHDEDWYDVWHPNALGHKIIGVYLVEQLNAKQLLPANRIEGK